VNIDEDGYKTVRRPRPRTLGQCAPAVFAVDAEKSGDRVTKEWSKKNLHGTVVWRSCATTGVEKERFWSGAREISSVERVVIKNAKGEVNEVRATPVWERVTVQIDSGAIDTVGSKEITKAFEMKETEM
jgi:hypothetical protein